MCSFCHPETLRDQQMMTQGMLQGCQHSDPSLPQSGGANDTPIVYSTPQTILIFRTQYKAGKTISFKDLICEYLQIISLKLIAFISTFYFFTITCCMQLYTTLHCTHQLYLSLSQRVKLHTATKLCQRLVENQVTETERPSTKSRSREYMWVVKINVLMGMLAILTLISTKNIFSTLILFRFSLQPNPIYYPAGNTVYLDVAYNNSCITSY